ncbi:MAG: TetR/AcrR family transcriptional regulator [Muribaculaceae bacterium]|nr:TetR/AcrR family transcriptional regulator [Muribaculaceae bacterium]
MVTKTRDKLIEVARQLFANKGIENTTMNDIANASDKGRRTIYTYFKNKREIYDAVIERESEQLIQRLRQIVSLDVDPVDKLRQYLLTRFEIVDETIHRRDSSLRSFFRGDFRRIDRIRRLAVAKERELFDSIIVEGVERGVFDPGQAKNITTLETIVFQGVDYTHLRNNFKQIKLTPDTMRSSIVDFMVNGVIARSNDSNVIY